MPIKMKSCESLKSYGYIGILKNARMYVPVEICQFLVYNLKIRIYWWLENMIMLGSSLAAHIALVDWIINN